MSLSSILRRVRHAADRRFDREHRLDTCEIIEKPNFVGMPAEIGRDSTPYIPSGSTRVRRLIRRSRIDPSEYHFVDLGTGKGRPLLIASGYPFKSITGIEADHELCGVARANVQAWSRSHAGPPIGVIEGDVRTASLPEGNLFVFMYNPFVGEVFEAVAKRLAEVASTPRKVIVAYSGDSLADTLERAGTFRRLPIRPLRPWQRSSMSLFFNAAADPKRR